MCGAKLSDRKYTSEFMERFGLEETVKRSRSRWMRVVFRREDDEPVRKRVGSGIGWHKRVKEDQKFNRKIC